MEVWGSPNAFKNRAQKSNKGLIKETPSQDPSKGGFGEGSGSILGAFWEDFGGIWEPRGSPYGRENRYMSKDIQVLPPGSPKGGFGEGSGRVWGDLGRVLEGFSEDFSVNLVMFSWGILGNPREGGWGNLRET